MVYHSFISLVNKWLPLVLANERNGNSWAAERLHVWTVILAEALGENAVAFAQPERASVVRIDRHS